MKASLKPAITLLLIIIFSQQVYAKAPLGTFHGTVPKVSDGDTFKIIPDKLIIGAKTNIKGEVSIRLYGVDAPETKKPQWPAQPYSESAKDYLARLVEGKTIICEMKDLDRYQRAVCIVMVNGKNVNLEMVRAGYAWAYTKYLDRPYASEYIGIEEEARQARKGLWKESNPTPPWEFRKVHRNGR